MNRKVTNYVVIIISLSFIIFMITANKNVLESVSFSISIWKNNLFPTLFPFFVVSNILIQYDFINIIGKILNKPLTKLFNLPPSCSFVLIISLFSGFPSGAKYTNELVKRKIISNDDAERLLTFTHYSNPLFILGFISLVIGKYISFLILIAHIISGLIVGILFNYNKKINYSIIDKKTNQDKAFGNILKSSIEDSLNTMFLLLGIVTIFLIFTEMINTIFNLPPLLNSIVSGIFEMTQGIKKISNLNISNYLKTILTTNFISFGGLSVHLQVIGIISENKIRYKKFFLARIMHSIISVILVSILYFLFIS